MFAHAIPAQAHDDPGPHGPGPHDADTQGYREVLHDLIHLGAGLARCLHNQAIAQAAQQAAAHSTQPAPDAQQPTDTQIAPASEALISLTLAFDRIARAVRRSILLARSLAHPVQPAPAQDPARHRAATRRQIIREVEDTIQRTGKGTRAGRDDEHDGAGTLQAELHDRLDAPDLDDDIGTRPAADIISEICRDLGLAAPPGGAHPWKRRTPGDIAQLCADAAAPSGARQPGAGPQILRCDAAQPTPGPQPDKPAAISPAQSDPIHAGSDPLEDTASTLATILRHPTRAHGRCRPPLPA